MNDDRTSERPNDQAPQKLADPAADGSGLEWREKIRGRHPGDQYIRINTHPAFKRIRRGIIAPRPGEAEAATRPGQLVVIQSPYRSLLGPLVTYIDAIQEIHPTDMITVILPEYVPRHWWEHLLHNQTALRIKAALLFHPRIVVVNVPYHLPE